MQLTGATCGKNGKGVMAGMLVGPSIAARVAVGMLGLWIWTVAWVLTTATRPTCSFGLFFWIVPVAGGYYTLLPQQRCLVDFVFGSWQIGAAARGYRR